MAALSLRTGGMAPTLRFVAAWIPGSARLGSGCDGSAGKDGRGIPGADGRDGQDGQDGEDGQDGQDGTDRQNGGNVDVTLFHGRAALLEEQYTEAGASPAVATITGATADANGEARARVDRRLQELSRAGFRRARRRST
jgi:hypothetical protein